MADRIRRLTGHVLAVVPTLLVLAALGGIASWGHRTNWKAPSFSQVAGTARPGPAEDWCAEHNVPESRCVACNPQLLGADPNDWCGEHGVPESKCTLCNPSLLAGGAADWCAEHGVPESGCTICNPGLAGRTTPAASSSGGVTPVAAAAACCPHDGAGTPAETVHPVAHDGHDHPEAEHAHADHADHSTALPAAAHAEHDGHDHAPHAAGGGAHAGHDHDAHAGHNHAAHAAQGPKDPKTCLNHMRRVQLASGESVSKVGIELAHVEQRPVVEDIAANAEINYDQTAVAQVSPRAAGVVWRVDRQVGQWVNKGDVLALVDAAEVGKAKAELLAAAAALRVKTQAWERVKTSAESGFRTQADLQAAEAGYREARVRHFNARQALLNLGLPIPSDTQMAESEAAVHFLGLPEAVVESLDPDTTTANLLPLVAPLDGVVIERRAVAGEATEPGRPLFTVADTRRMWVTIDVPIEQMKQVRVGQPIAFEADGNGIEPVPGQVTWISTAVDEQTRTVKVRADVANPDGRLLAHTFGRAKFLLRQQPQATVVPSEAVQWEGCCHVVFVQVAEGLFQPRKVRLGTKAGEFAEVTVGLLPGETIAAAGSHVLKSELLKGNLGDTCGGH